MKSAIATVMVSACLAALSLATAGVPAGLQAGDPAPNVPLQLASGAQTSLSALRGRLLLIDFFITT